jgi:probable F420-dependent oxidoreductase
VSELGVVLPYWPGRPPSEALEVADVAEKRGFAELWVGEMATFDAFALGAVIAARCPRISMTIGPLAVAVRDPVAFALGVGTVAEVGGRTPGLALGASTPVVVEHWHGRTWAGSVARLGETVRDVRALLSGEKVHGFRMRVATPSPSITVAAFGDRSVAIAGDLGDRMVINLVTSEQAKRLRERLDASVPLAAWVPVAVDPTDETLVQLRQALVAYLAAPGYGEMLAAAGFGALVERARRGAHPRELFEAIGPELLDVVGALGDVAHVRARLDEYRQAGVSHVAVVPGAITDLTALA